MNVTERRRAEEALQASESRFRRLAEANLIGVITTDFAGRVWEANDAFLSIVGYSGAELESGSIRQETITPKEFNTRQRNVVPSSCEPVEWLSRLRRNTFVKTEVESRCS